jgi:hypothetical protein
MIKIFEITSYSLPPIYVAGGPPPPLPLYIAPGGDPSSSDFTDAEDDYYCKEYQL